jgi:hypothetical protein
MDALPVLQLDSNQWSALDQLVAALPADPPGVRPSAASGVSDCAAFCKLIEAAKLLQLRNCADFIVTLLAQVYNLQRWMCFTLVKTDNLHLHHQVGNVMDTEMAS